MTKEELQQFYYLNKNIEELREKHLETRTRIEKCTSTPKAVNIQYQPDSQSKLDELVPLLLELEQEIDQMVIEATKVQIRIYKAIEVLNEREKRIIRLRYLDLLSWPQVAYKMCYCKSQVHTFHGIALEKLRKS
jgi:DNA-directed RNA polymerase specialized sigma subunit